MLSAFFFCLVGYASAQSVDITLNQSAADAFGAYCLNGAPPSYNIRTNSSNTKWILFLEGGGWCYGPTANGSFELQTHTHIYFTF